MSKLKSKTKSSNWLYQTILAAPLILLLAIQTNTAQAQYLSAFDCTAINYSKTTWPDLDGSSVKMALVELSENHIAPANTLFFMPDLNLPTLNNINIIDIKPHYDFKLGNSNHATMIAGLLWGRDKNNALGIVPNAQVFIYEANWFILHCALNQPENLQADILSISWGKTDTDHISQWWQRAIDSYAQKNNKIIIAAAGNSDTIHYPSAGYNIISVGAADAPALDASLVDFVQRPDAQNSSTGPTSDKRCKPDIIAPGVFAGPTTTGHIGIPQVPSSSFAVPYVTGAAAMLVDACNKFDISGNDPRLIKSLLLTSANKLTGWHKGRIDTNDDPFVPLDYQQGAGLLDASGALEILFAGQYQPQAINNPKGWDIAQLSLDYNPTKNYIFDNPLQVGQHFTATLCWHKKYNDDNNHLPLKNDILILMLWSVDENDNFVEPLDISISIVDNLQHIYYKNETENLRIGLSVYAMDGCRENIEPITYALSYSAAFREFFGDELIGDINNDGIIDSQDFKLLLNKIINENYSHNDNRYFHRYDLNFDGKVDRLDLQVIYQNFGQQANWLNYTK